MDIKDLVEEEGYTPKRKAACHGGEYSSACPFCKEGDDRFLIWPDRCNKNGNYAGGRYSCRVCGEYGDAIKFLSDLYGLSYLNACDRLKLIPQKQTTTATQKIYKPPVAKEPSAEWIERVTIFVEWCHSKLMNSPAALAQVQARGFTIETIERFKLGFNPGCNHGRDFYRARQEWGLPELLKEDGIPRTLWLPVGFIIPTFSTERKVVKVKVRRTNWNEGDKLPKYVEISGSKSCPSVYGNTLLSIGLVLESEFDGLLIQQAASDLLYCISLGGSTKQLDAETYALFRQTKNILFLPDFDKAGAVAWLKWKKMFPAVNRILTPHEKSAGDYLLNGGDLREWLSDCILRIS